MKTKTELSINDVREIATKAHAGQFRRDGITPYITHPEAVAESLMGERGYIVMAALLHDVIEDTYLEAPDLLNLGVPWEVVDAVLLLTHVEGQSYEEYIHWIAQNEIARKVKIADIKHNLSCNPSPRKKPVYEQALIALTS